MFPLLFFLFLFLPFSSSKNHITQPIVPFPDYENYLVFGYFPLYSDTNADYRLINSADFNFKIVNKIKTYLNIYKNVKFLNFVPEFSNQIDLYKKYVSEADNSFEKHDFHSRLFTFKSDIMYFSNGEYVFSTSVTYFNLFNSWNDYAFSLIDKESSPPSVPLEIKPIVVPDTKTKFKNTNPLKNNYLYTKNNIVINIDLAFNDHEIISFLKKKNKTLYVQYMNNLIKYCLAITKIKCSSISTIYTKKLFDYNNLVFETTKLFKLNDLNKQINLFKKDILFILVDFFKSIVQFHQLKENLFLDLTDIVTILDFQQISSF